GCPGRSKTWVAATSVCALASTGRLSTAGNQPTAAICKKVTRGMDAFMEGFPPLRRSATEGGGYPTRRTGRRIVHPVRQKNSTPRTNLDHAVADAFHRHRRDQLQRHEEIDRPARLKRT